MWFCPMGVRTVAITTYIEWDFWSIMRRFQKLIHEARELTWNNRGVRQNISWNLIFVLSLEDHSTEIIMAYDLWRRNIALCSESIWSRKKRSALEFKPSIPIASLVRSYRSKPNLPYNADDFCAVPWDDYPQKWWTWHNNKKPTAANVLIDNWIRTYLISIIIGKTVEKNRVPL